MNPKVAFALAFLAIAHQACSRCLCGGFGDGKDICNIGRIGGGGGGGGKKCVPLAIRPAQLPKVKIESITKPRVVCQTLPGIINTLKPIGDLCSCKQSIVVPAVVPRPVCSCSGYSGSGSGSGSNSDSYPILDSGSPVLDGANTEYIVEEQGPASALIDPVSLSLAFKEQSKVCGGISEGRLAYGFRKIPVDAVDERVQQDDFDEHALYAHNGQIVELKKLSCGRPSISIDEEALAELEAEAEVDAIIESGGDVTTIGRPDIKPIRYGDVGFGVAQIKTNPFRQIVDVVDVNPEPEVTEGVRICNDGYRPGNVIYKSTPVRETYTGPVGITSDCGSEDTDYRPYYSYSSSSASSPSAPISSSGSSSLGCHRCSHSKVYY